MTLPVKEPWAIVATSLRVVREAVCGHARAERACQNACRAQARGAEVRSATATTRVDAQQIRASARSARLARWIDGDEWRREQPSGRVPPDLMERWVGAVRTMDAIVLEAFSKRELLEVIDMTEFVAEQRARAGASGFAGLQTPVERVYVPADPMLSERLGLAIG